MSAVRIVIFAKAPRPGVVKTRLIPALGAAGAAALAARMLAHAIAAAQRAQVGDVELCCAPLDDAIWAALQLPAGLQMSEQGDGSLGARMARASERVLRSGAAILLIGTDSPGLDATRLREAVTALQAVDAVMIPAVDGGYVALGLNRYDARVFDGIAWSSAAVAAQTVARFTQLGWSHRVLAAEHDIDDPPDLQFVPQSWLS